MRVKKETVMMVMMMMMMMRLVRASTLICPTYCRKTQSQTVVRIVKSHKTGNLKTSKIQCPPSHLAPFAVAMLFF